jgi:hypothetical protein
MLKCKVFSATMVADRVQLGEKITEWLQKNRQVFYLDIEQSSDDLFHCVTLMLTGGELSPADTGLVTHAEYPGRCFRSVKVFSSTKAKEREILGETVEAFAKEHNLDHDEVGLILGQSSDSEFHCTTIVMLY